MKRLVPLLAVLALALAAVPTRSQNIDIGALAAAAKGGNAAQQAMQRLQADERRLQALEEQVKALQRRVFPRPAGTGAPVPPSATIESRLAAAEKGAAAVEARLAKLEARVRALEARK